MNVVKQFQPKTIGEQENANLLDVLTSRKKIFVDPGKNTVKVLVLDELNEIKHFYAFPSKLSDVRKFATETPKEGQFFIKVKNGRKVMPLNKKEEPKYYDRYCVLGNGGASVETESDKNTFHHRLCIYTAIHQFVEDGEEVDLIIGYPTDNYGNSDLRKNYIDGVLKGNGVMNVKGDEPVAPGTISLEVNGVLKTFYIREVDVFQEGLGFLTLQYLAYQAQLEAINGKKDSKRKKNTPEILQTIFVDIGGYNINLHIRENGAYTQHTSLDKVGINILHKELIEAFRNEISDGAILDKIENIDWNEAISTQKILGQTEIGSLDVAEFLLVTIDSFIRKHVVEEIKQKFYKDIIKNEHIALVFLGGGSLRLQPYLESILDEKAENGTLSFSPVPLWDNVLSYAFLYFTKKSQLVKSNTLSAEDQQALINHLQTTCLALVENGSNVGFIQEHLFKSSCSSIYSENFVANY